MLTLQSYIHWVQSGEINALEIIKKYQEKVDKQYLRLQVLERMETLQEEIEDMKNIVKEDILGQDKNDEEIKRVNDRIKELERKIVEIIENKEEKN